MSTSVKNVSDVTVERQKLSAYFKEEAEKYRYPINAREGALGIVFRRASKAAEQDIEHQSVLIAHKAIALNDAIRAYNSGSSEITSAQHKINVYLRDNILDQAIKSSTIEEISSHSGFVGRGLNEKAEIPERSSVVILLPPQQVALG